MERMTAGPGPNFTKGDGWKKGSERANRRCVKINLRRVSGIQKDRGERVITVPDIVSDCGVVTSVRKCKLAPIGKCSARAFQVQLFFAAWRLAFIPLRVRRVTNGGLYFHCVRRAVAERTNGI